MPKLRFSIQSMLIFTTFVAIVIWWLAVPSVTAARFAKLIEGMQYQRAGEMFVDGQENIMLTEWGPIVRANAVPQDVTAKDLLYGRRRISLTVAYQATSKEVLLYSRMEASFRGIRKLEATPYASGEFKFR